MHLLIYIYIYAQKLFLYVSYLVNICERNPIRTRGKWNSPISFSISESFQRQEKLMIT